MLYKFLNQAVNSLNSKLSFLYFTEYNLEKITLGDSVTNIDTFAFYFCESLEEIIIPDNITYIGHNTFSKCKSLNEVVFKGKTLEEVKLMKNYPFGIEDENVFKSS